MKIKFLIITVLASFLLSTCIYAAKPLPRVNAAAAVLMDFPSGKLLYSKNPHVRMEPASTTKIMTAVLALENLTLTKIVTVSAEGAHQEGSSIHLTTGEQITIRGLLWGLLLESGNDSAVEIGKAISGSEVKFAALMTAKAHSLGMNNTQFKNASGLPAEGHYTTAYDLAVLTGYALRDPDFAYIVKTKVKYISGSDSRNPRKLVNHNHLLWNYPYATGVKTGYTPTAGGCLVASATYRGKTLIAVVLKTGTTYSDCTQLLNYGFGF